MRSHYPQTRMISLCNRIEGEVIVSEGFFDSSHEVELKSQRLVEISYAQTDKRAICS